MPNWTPGPWIHDLIGDGNRRCVFGALFAITPGDEPHRRYCIAETIQAADVTDEEMTATAALIASAPDLYEALDSVGPVIEFITLTVKMSPERTKAFQDLHAKVRAALAKARGEHSPCSNCARYPTATGAGTKCAKCGRAVAGEFYTTDREDSDAW